MDCHVADTPRNDGFSFLYKKLILQGIIKEIGLATLTLLIAESDPKNKEIIINMLTLEE